MPIAQTHKPRWIWQVVEEECSINKILVKVLHLVDGEKQGVEEVCSIKNILVKVLHLLMRKSHNGPLI